MGKKLYKDAHAVDFTAAQAMLNRVQKTAFEIGDSRLYRRLSRETTPPELAGALLFCSIDALIQAGLDPDEIMKRHAEMVRVAMQVRMEQLNAAREKGSGTV